MYFRMRKKNAKDVSLYEPIGTDKEGNQIHLLDIVESEQVDVVEEMEKNRKIQRMMQILPEVLNAREQEIIINRYGLFQKKTMTQRELAARMGISRSYVSRIEKRALDKLKLNF